jgi:hypothetical protein
MTPGLAMHAIATAASFSAAGYAVGRIENRRYRCVVVLVNGLFFLLNLALAVRQRGWN